MGSNAWTAVRASIEDAFDVIMQTCHVSPVVSFQVNLVAVKTIVSSRYESQSDPKPLLVT